jgi:hypothetical protein
VGEAGTKRKKSEITFSIFQSKEMEGRFRAEITSKESPSMVKLLSFKETAREAARRAAKASPKVGSHGGLICEIALIILPSESLQTAAWAEKFPLIAVSKFILKWPTAGGCQTSETWWETFHAEAWSKEVFLMEFAKERASRITPSWEALFLENHRRSQRTAAKIWKRWESAKGIPKEEWGLIIPSTQLAGLREDQARESKGQKEDLQATLAKMHLKRRWDKESGSAWQRGQRESAGEIGKILFNLVFVGTMSQAIFQRKIMSLALRFSFQSFFQVLGERGEDAAYDLDLLMSLYAELEEKRPFGEGVQKDSEMKWGWILIFCISLTLIGSNRKRRRGRFHKQWGIIRSQTLMCGRGCSRRLEGEGKKFGRVGIQGEDQTGKEEFWWTLWQEPREIMDWVLRIPFQSQDGEEWGGGERKVPEERYLPWRWATHAELKFVWSFQPSLEIRARLTSFIFLNPRPPWSFGRQRESQDLRERFLVFFEGKPHQKFLNILSREEQREDGSKKELMAYEGMAAATDLIRTSLPAWDRVFARQPSILLRTLSLMLWKAAVFELPNKIGRPRYIESVGLEV